jgi:hypothetical protein
MSKIALSGNPSGTGTLTIAAPNTNSDATINLPTVTGGDFIVSNASGNVGIGTATPNSQGWDRAVTVNGAGNAAYTIDVDGVNASAFAAGLSSVVLDARGGRHINFQIDGANKLRINQDGTQQSVIPGGSTLLPEYKCRAWVNFDGTTATPSTIRGSGNVSSVTKNGTGDYTVNFTTAMPDVNYSISGYSNFATAVSAPFITGLGQQGSYLTSSVRVSSYSSNNNAVRDGSIVCILVFR